MRVLQYKPAGKYCDVAGAMPMSKDTSTWLPWKQWEAVPRAKTGSTCTP